MANWNLEKELFRLETILDHVNADFIAAYMAVRNLHALSRNHPQIIRPRTVSVLKHMLKRPTHTVQKMSFFLYKETADALVTILIHTPEKSLAAQSLLALRHIICTVSGKQQKAAAEAIGALPLRIHGPVIREKLTSDIPCLTWRKLLALQGIKTDNSPELMGRSIVVKLENKSNILVVKTAAEGKSVDLINREAQWMKTLSSGAYSFPVRFEIPQPVNINGNFVFRLQNPPLKLPHTTDSNGHCYAIAFSTNKDYFCYPNDHNSNRRPGNQDFKEILFRNAWLLGKLSAMGIVHLAPIPLFHNRAQQTRRADQGLYEWPRGGRLDRWLYSCRYPNFGLTGLRDFEHLVTVQEIGGKIYQQIGTQILSLLLVAGSYFRNKDADCYGIDTQGKPVDARSLFDRPFFKELIDGIFTNYYNGFSKETFQGKIPLSSEQFISRMIDEMGIDRHMQEIFRVLDQREMTDNEFKAFLEQRGFTDEEITQVKKGAQDITLQTGPHLGRFNDRISLPELTEFVSAASAFCVAGKYKQQRNQLLACSWMKSHI